MARTSNSELLLKQATTKILKSTLIPFPVVSATDIEIFRIIRNEGVGTYSNNDVEIDAIQQQDYWSNNFEYIKAYLYEDLDGDIVAIGSLRVEEDNNRLWSFVAVSKKARGKGYSTEVLAHLLEVAGSTPVWGKVRTDNPPSTFMCVDTGNWLMVSREGNIVTVVYKRECQDNNK